MTYIALPLLLAFFMFSFCLQESGQMNAVSDLMPQNSEHVQIALVDKQF